MHLRRRRPWVRGSGREASGRETRKESQGHTGMGGAPGWGPKIKAPAYLYQFQPREEPLAEDG